jgi:hypothetical protein
VYSIISSGPSAAHNQRSASFAFQLAMSYGIGVARASFECQLQEFDAQLGYYEWVAWLPCRSPAMFDDLRDGMYRFRVRSATEGGRKSAATIAERDFAVRDCPTTSYLLGWVRPSTVGRHPLQVHCMESSPRL